MTRGIIEIISEFIIFKNKKLLDEITLEQLTDCIKLRRDINTDKFIKPILKHVAPNFHFDNLKLLDNDIENNNLFIDDVQNENSKIK